MGAQDAKCYIPATLGGKCMHGASSLCSAERVGNKQSLCVTSLTAYGGARHPFPHISSQNFLHIIEGEPERVLFSGAGCGSRCGDSFAAQNTRR